MSSWDRVVHLFDTSSEEIPPEVEDNVQVAWPVLIEQLRSHLEPSLDGVRVLDFGCGTGGLARGLAALGFEVLGVDSSSGMIARAQQQRQERTSFFVGSFQDIPAAASFQGVVASMAFQFVPDLKGCLARLTDHLLPGGVLAFAVFNPRFVAEKGSEVFEPREGEVVLKLREEDFPVAAVWSAEEYRDLLEGLGYTSLDSRCHAFPEGSPGAPEYLIMTFKKRV